MVLFLRLWRLIVQKVNTNSLPESQIKITNKKTTLKWPKSKSWSVWGFFLNIAPCWADAACRIEQKRVLRYINRCLTRSISLSKRWTALGGVVGFCTQRKSTDLKTAETHCLIFLWVFFVLFWFWLLLITLKKNKDKKKGLTLPLLLSRLGWGLEQPQRCSKIELFSASEYFSFFYCLSSTSSSVRVEVTGHQMMAWLRLTRRQSAVS